MQESCFWLLDAECYLAAPDRPGCAWVLAIHGSGRCALDYRDTPFYARQRDIALENGCAFAAMSLGQDVWGKETALRKLEALYAFMTKAGYARQCVIWASSAGGTLMFRLAQRHPAWVAGMIGIFPVWDMERITLPSLSAAYGLSGAALQDAVIKVNPARYPEALPDVPLVICHGLGDQVVPPAFHALALAQTYPLSLHLTRDGHSTQAFSLYDTPLIAGLLQSYVLKEG